VEPRHATWRFCDGGRLFAADVVDNSAFGLVREILPLENNPSPRPSREEETPARASRDHHSVYVVYLRNPKGDGKAGYYVGMTGLSPEQRFANHKRGVRAARVVRKYGDRLVPRLYAHLNPMPYAKAQRMEVALAESLRKRGFNVYGGH
jgi:predicted GIY-YIG superfamily endonuclease